MRMRVHYARAYERQLHNRFFFVQSLKRLSVPQFTPQKGAKNGGPKTATLKLLQHTARVYPMNNEHVFQMKQFPAAERKNVQCLGNLQRTTLKDFQVLDIKETRSNPA